MASHAAQALDGAAYRALFEAGARCVEVYADAINALNVFPVPDGDTGINMVLTLRAAVSGAEGAEDGVAAVSKAISRAALYGARGNSGVIMSQFLKGAAVGLEDCEECDGEALARSLASAADAGYQAVGKPVEGTMLTVMRAAAEGAAQANASPAQALRAAYEAAEVALAKTPEQLPVLAEAGVVDAGGQGVVAFLAGALGEIEGKLHEVTSSPLADGIAAGRLIVVGGGDAALEEGIFLTKYASEVYIVHRRDQLRASQIMQERAFKNDKIKFIWDTVVEDIKGDTDKVTGATLKNVKTGETQLFPIDGVFIFVGHIPNTELFTDVINMDEQGYIIVDDMQRTNINGVYAAGDVHDHVFRQAITAAGAGAAAAIASEKFVAELENRAYPGN